MKTNKANTPLATVVLVATLLLSPALTARAQFTLVTNNGAITITHYAGPGGAVTIPGFVTAIGDSVFGSLGSLTSITIPTSVTNIGSQAFTWCVNLASLTLPPNLASVGGGAFSACTSLTNVTIPASVNFLGRWAFFYCPNLQGLYFNGNAPAVGGDIFSDNYSYNNDITTVYYYSGAAGWSDAFSGRPMVELAPLFTYAYVTNSGSITATITGYGGPGGAVDIPSTTLDGYPVNSIGNGAFFCTRT